MKTKQLGKLKEILAVVVMGLLLFSALTFMIMSTTLLLDKASAQINSVVSASYKVSACLAALVMLFSFVLPILCGTDEDEEEHRKKIRTEKFIGDFIVPWILVLVFAVVILIYCLIGFTVKDEIFGLVIMLCLPLSFVVSYKTHKRLAKKIKERFFST